MEPIELTLILKSLGFNLESFDFNGNITGENEVEIIINCNRSGIKSKMKYRSPNCSCPIRTPINDISYWDVEGIDPMLKQRSTKYEEKSSNLLPNLSRRSTLVTNSLITAIFKVYKNELFCSHQPEFQFNDKSIEKKEDQTHTDLIKPLESEHVTPTTNNSEEKNVPSASVNEIGKSQLANPELIMVFISIFLLTPINIHIFFQIMKDVHKQLAEIIEKLPENKKEIPKKQSVANKPISSVRPRLLFKSQASKPKVPTVVVATNKNKNPTIKKRF